MLPEKKALNIFNGTAPKSFLDNSGLTKCPKARYRHIRNYYLSNSKTFQDGNGNGNFEEINSNDFLDGNWEPMEMKGATAGAKTVTVMVI